MDDFSRGLLDQSGITLVEILVVVVLISIISGVLVANFPMIKLQLGLSRAVHFIAQDIKTAQGLSGSGHQIKLSNGDLVQPKGYGIYINTEIMGNKKYLLYADINGDHQYNQTIDYTVKEVDLSQLESGIIIKEIHNAPTNGMSINFAPPNFDTTISNLLPNYNRVEIVIAINSAQEYTRTIYVNKAGLIETK